MDQPRPGRRAGAGRPGLPLPPPTGWRRGPNWPRPGAGLWLPAGRAGRLEGTCGRTDGRKVSGGAGGRAVRTRGVDVVAIALIAGRSITLGMPSLDCNFFMSPACEALTRDTTRPDAPARPVRPER
jgi:hypothetical protein